MKTVSSTWQCDDCGGVFEKEWSDKEAEKELRANFGNIPVEQCGLVCDDCYQKYVGVKMKPSAKIIADSLSPQGHRLTTMEVIMHRFVLAEFNTHRVFSRNSASSRAIPAWKIRKKVVENPAFPISGHWSPFEHVAGPMILNAGYERQGSGIYQDFCGNFRGWKQFRKEFSNENRTNFIPNLPDLGGNNESSDQ